MFGADAALGVDENPPNFGDRCHVADTHGDIRVAETVRQVARSGVEPRRIGGPIEP